MAILAADPRGILDLLDTDRRHWLGVHSGPPSVYNEAPWVASIPRPRWKFWRRPLLQLTGYERAPLHWRPTDNPNRCLVGYPTRFTMPAVSRTYTHVAIWDAPSGGRLIGVAAITPTTLSGTSSLKVTPTFSL